jgi:hypothetical protein
MKIFRISRKILSDMESLHGFSEEQTIAMLKKDTPCDEIVITDEDAPIARND